MPRDNRPNDPTDGAVHEPSSDEAIARWRDLTPATRDVLAHVTGREPLATNLRKARENRGLSQEVVAKKLRLSRSLVAQIELANRPVSDDELATFADLYGTSVVELTGTPVATDDPVTTALLNLVPALSRAVDMQAPIHGVLGALAATSHLASLLGRPTRNGPPTYRPASPRTLADAIRQGEDLAERERQRLHLRRVPLTDLADLCAAEGVPVFALTLPDDVSCLFLAHATVGVAIVVNSTHDAARQRLAIAHAYAHAVCEPMGSIRVCTHAIASQLMERRADAFAGAFLLPTSAVLDTVRDLGKGQGSRRVQWVFATATERAERAEERSTPGSQVVTYLDAACVARRFGTAYRLAVSRLLGLGVISDTDSARLLKPKVVELAGEWLALFGRAATDKPTAVTVLSDLNAERAYMAVEAYRRRLLSKADLSVEALSLQVPGLSEARLLAFAEAAR
ncbi:MAG: ImmA/IrrE family metallo-endopeptidase [Vicinamibacterales bacterium]